MAPSARLVYMVMAHRLPAQLVRLVSRLDSANAVFLVHVDRRTRQRPFFEVAAPLREMANVAFLPSLRVHWGFYSLVEPVLAGLDAAVDRAAEFDHFVLLSGQDYPIKPREAIEAHFARNPGVSFMRRRHIGAGSSAPAHLRDRVAYRHYRTPFRLDRPPEHRVVRVPSRFTGFVPRPRLPAGMEPYKGFGWWSLSREATQYARDFVQRNPGYVRAMKRAFAVDELFFQTLLMSSPLAGSVVDDDLRHIEWRPGSFHPAVLEPADLPALADSPALFARKFDAEAQPETLDLVDRELLGLSAASPAS